MFGILEDANFVSKTMLAPMSAGFLMVKKILQNS
jgi:hypothetical protein